MSRSHQSNPELAANCIQTLTGWAPFGPSQERLRRQFLGHLAEHADGWARTCAGSHLTASALIGSPTARQVLLTLHARIGRWLQTGGHLEIGDTSLSAAALREAVEESGVAGMRVDPVPLLLSRHQVTCSGQPTYHLDVQYLAVAPVTAAPVVGVESLDVRWFDVAALPDVDESVLDLITAAGRRLGQRWP